MNLKESPRNPVEEPPEEEVTVTAGRTKGNEELSPAGRSRRSFLRSLTVLFAGAAVVGPKVFKSMIEAQQEEGGSSEKTEQTNSFREQYESKETRERIGREFADTCAFYADTLSSSEISLNTAEEVRDYLGKTFERYLMIYSVTDSLIDRGILPVPEEGTAWSASDLYLEGLISEMVPSERIAEARASKKSALEAVDGISLPLPSVEQAMIADHLLKRFNMVLSIQKTIQDKMREAGLQEVHVQGFLVDGRLGRRTLALCSNIASDEYFWDMWDLFQCADQDREKEILDTLRSGEVTVPLPKFSKEEYERISGMYSGLHEKFPVDDSLRESFIQMTQRFDAVGREFREAVGAAGSDEGKAREVQIAFFNYYMDLWRDSPTRGQDGNARYPFEPGKVSDCTTFVFQILRRMFPDIPPKIQLGYSDKQVEDYGKYFGQEPAEVMPKGVPADPGIYIVDGRGHMFLVAPDLKTGLYSICEAGEGIMSTVFLPSDRYTGINVSTGEAMEKMVGRT